MDEMTYYQATQLALAGFDGLLVVGLLAYMLLLSRGRFPWVVAFAVLVGILGCFFFLVSFFSADQDLPRVLQVAVKLLRDLPVVMIVCYACLLQARKYGLVRNARPALIRLFSSGPRLVLTGYGLGALLEFAFRPPVLDSDAALPPLALVSDVVVLLPLMSYAGASSVVFFATALRSEGASQRAQNFCGAAALGATAALCAHTFLWRIIRVSVAPEDIAPYIRQLSTDQVVIVAVIALSVTLGLIFHLRERSPETASDRFIRFLDLVGASSTSSRPLDAPSLTEARIAVPYHAMHRASEEDLLDLSDPRREGADTLFRFVLSSHQHFGGAPGSVRAEERGQLVERRDPRPGSGFALDVSPAEVGISRDDPLYLYEPLRLFLRLENSRDDAGDLGADSAPVWFWLSCIALADAGLVPKANRGARNHSEALDAYELAKYEFENSGPGFHREDGFGRQVL